MSKSMFMKKPNHRVFDYTPRYYSPETDEQERKKRKLGFTRELKFKRKRRNPIIWILLIFAVIWVILKLNGMG